jgi:3-isopropylmalate/(R)-2-methylmalate dehydratase small subunit
LNNAVLPVTVSDAFLKKAMDAIEANPKTIITVNLEDQKVILEDGTTESFDINQYKKTCLMNGYDDIDYLLSLREDIKQFDLAH